MGVIQSITVACHTQEEYGSDEIDFYLDDFSGQGWQFLGGVSIASDETKHFVPDAPTTLYFTDAISVRERDVLVDDNVAVYVVDIDKSVQEFESDPEWTSGRYTFTIRLDGPAQLRP